MRRVGGLPRKPRRPKRQRELFGEEIVDGQTDAAVQGLRLEGPRCQIGWRLPRCGPQLAASRSPALFRGTAFIFGSLLWCRFFLHFYALD